jgi:hypothetical protein
MPRRISAASKIVFTGMCASQLTEACRSGILVTLQSARPVSGKRANIISTVRQGISMVRQESSSPQAPDSRLEREIERERHEHSLNQDAKTRLRLDEDERHKDARATSLSSKVRR